MFKCALKDRVITVNNPSIWRPLLGIEDAATAYIRSIEANQKISGIFNAASGNYTVGEVADLVRNAIQERMKLKIDLNIKHVQDFRNYKVSTQKAANVLSFHPTSNVKSIVYDLIDNFKKFEDMDNPMYSNIATFKKIEKELLIHDMENQQAAPATEAITV